MPVAFGGNQFKNWLQPYDFAPQSQPSSPASATKICPETGLFLDFFFHFAGKKFEFLDVDFLGLSADPCFDP